MPPKPLDDAPLRAPLPAPAPGRQSIPDPRAPPPPAQAAPEAWQEARPTRAPQVPQVLEL
jgi:hypothetical protein